jgi:hypothetical protein
VGEVESGVRAAGGAAEAGKVAALGEEVVGADIGRALAAGSRHIEG